MEYKIVILFYAVSICAGVHVNINIAPNSEIPESDKSFDDTASSLSKSHGRQIEGASEPTANESFDIKPIEKKNKNDNNAILQRNEQDYQNKEFEKYIRKFHSGPTVETVYESTIPSQQRKSARLQSDRANDGSPNIQSYGKFELHMAAANNAHTSENVNEIKPIFETPPKLVYNQNFHGFQVSGGNVYSTDYATNTDFNIQYPEEPPEISNSYGNYYGYPAQPNIYNTMNSREYLPPHYQRPVVTKTIQIAQPALKAKKYEIRHPAIQKEFYDIEERVVIKPAGTIVVELERPVAKIPKGEAILPLGHPHPAIAGAYNNVPRVTQTQFTTDTITSSGIPEQPKQAIPSPFYDPKPTLMSTTIASAITTSQTLDRTTNDDLIAANLNGQHHVENQFLLTTTVPVQANENYDSQESNNVSNHPNQSQTPDSHNFYYTRDETDFSKDAKSEGNFGNSPGPTNSRYKFSYSANQNEPNRLNNSHNINQSEHFSNGAKKNINNYRSARIQEQPTVNRIQKINANVLKYEANIVLPPSQKKIYLSNTPITQFNDTTAPGTGIKEYLQSSRGPFLIYAISSQDFPQTPQTNASSKLSQSHLSQHYTEGKHSNIQYSAPYSQAVVLPDYLINKEETNIRMLSNEEPNIPEVQLSKTDSRKNMEFSELRQQTYLSAKEPQEDIKNIKSDCSSSNDKTKFQRIVEQPQQINESKEQHPLINISTENPDVDIKSRTGQIQPESRVIAATPAPTGAASESFHKRRIVVNHPFQTVREVVEHEPITNYHQVQVNEPASPSLYQAAYYHSKQGELRNTQMK